MGKVYIDSETEQENFVMQSEIDRLITEMLEMIYREFHVDFRNDFHLRMELNRHMVPFVLRMKYHMILRNPMLEEIRKIMCFLIRWRPRRQLHWGIFSAVDFRR